MHERSEDRHCICLEVLPYDNKNIPARLLHFSIVPWRTGWDIVLDGDATAEEWRSAGADQLVSCLQLLRRKKVLVVNMYRLYYFSLR